MLFFPKYWHIIGKDVSEDVISLFNGARDMDDVNNTHIVLIPKVKNPTSMTEYRPISLCNVIYKIA